MHALKQPSCEPSSLAQVLADYSLEMTTRDSAALSRAAHLLAPGTSIAIAFLPGEALEDRVETVRHVRDLGFEPKVHLPARRLQSEGQLALLLERLADCGGLKEVLVIAGDLDQPAGGFTDSLSVIETGLLERHGIETVSVGGHPEGHPAMTSQACFEWLERKVDAIGSRGMAPRIVTQFCFDSDAVLGWLEQLRSRGVSVPVGVGVPGPAGVKRLLTFAARCGVGASASVLRKYGVSLGQLLGSAGPDRLVNDLVGGLHPELHGSASLHFYPFGGLERSAEWIAVRCADPGVLRSGA